MTTFGVLIIGGFFSIYFELTNDIIYKAVDTYSALLFRICFYHVKNKQDSEDIIQEVFLALHSDRPKLVSQEHLKAWLIRVARNKTKNHIRNNAKRKTIPLDETMIAKCNFDSGNIGILEGLSTLKPIDRDIVFLHFYEGFSVKEIGDIVGKGAEAIFKRLQRAKQKMKVFLEEK